MPRKVLLQPRLCRLSPRREAPHPQARPSWSIQGDAVFLTGYLRGQSHRARCGGWEGLLSDLSQGSLWDSDGEAPLGILSHVGARLGRPAPAGPDGPLSVSLSHIHSPVLQEDTFKPQHLFSLESREVLFSKTLRDSTGSTDVASRGRVWAVRCWMPLDTALCPHSDLPGVTGVKSGPADSASGPPVRTVVGTVMRGAGHTPAERLRAWSWTETTHAPWCGPECHLPYRQTKDAAATRPSATAAVLTVTPGGLRMDGEKQDAGPRQRGLVKGTAPVSPDSCTFPCTENC